MIPTTGQIGFEETQKRNQLLHPALVLPKTTTANISKNDSQQKLETLAETVSHPLLSLTTLPFIKLFPITITIDVRKITIDETTFFKSHSVRSITYESLREVKLDTGIIAATLRFILAGQPQQPVVIGQLPNNQAVKAKQIVTGLLHCHKENIKSEDLDPEKDLEKIMILGRAAD